MHRIRKALRLSATAGLGAGGLYLGLVTGAVPIDVGLGRRVRPLGPQVVDIDAARERVFEIVAAPYAERPPRALREKVQVLARGSDLVLAAHHTPIRGRLRATTTETVRFEAPGRVDFRLVRGPVPHVQERFVLEEGPHPGSTRLTYSGELGTDLWGLGERWGNVVARAWERTVAQSLEEIRAEAERARR
ncbi:MAG TPA: SRPBCC family protein [Nocardioidaceae bacterium]|nr:SRPBCC family protein [Nocardioidaceae bacterium]